MIYLNWKGPLGRETVDEVDPADFTSRRAAMQYAKTLRREYAIVHMDVYTSSRACKGWK